MNVKYVSVELSSSLLNPNWVKYLFLLHCRTMYLMICYRGDKLQENGFREFLETLADRVRIRAIQKVGKEYIVIYNIAGSL